MQRLRGRASWLFSENREASEPDVLRSEAGKGHALKAWGLNK